MPGNGEIIERAINDFQKIQEHMENAKSENAVKTYEHLKKDYFHRNSFFVNSKFSSRLPPNFQRTLSLQQNQQKFDCTCYSKSHGKTGQIDSLSYFFLFYHSG